MFRKLFIVFILSLCCVDSFGAGKEGTQWTAREYPGLSFTYPSCAEKTSNPDVNVEAIYRFINSGKCPSSALGSWIIQVGRAVREFPAGTEFPKTLDTTIKIKGIAVTVLESEKKDVAEPWIAYFTCNKKSVVILYLRDTALPAPDWHHKMPQVFKEFLETARCEKI